MTVTTTDLCDRHADRVQVAEPLFRDFGGRLGFAGRIITLKVYEDSQLLEQRLATPGAGQVLVVDGSGSLHGALLDRSLAERAVANGWAGLVINGCVRHVAALGKLPLGIKALAVHPARSLRHQAGEQDIPVRFAGVHFLPGHYLYADEDGLVITEQPLD